MSVMDVLPGPHGPIGHPGPHTEDRTDPRHEFETLDQAREVIAAYIDHYHHRPHSGLNYRTPSEVRQTWDDAGEPLQNTAA
jgi:transposase InsO family protein